MNGGMRSGHRHYRAPVFVKVVETSGCCRLGWLVGLRAAEHAEPE